MAGRHRKPSNVKKNLKRTGSGFAAAATLTAIPVVPSAASAGPDGGWGPIIECESSGNPTVENPSPKSSASGLFQFIDDTWAAYGGREFAPRAKDATPAEQLIVAERAYKAEGTRPWNASKSCWAGKQASEPKALEQKPAPKPAPAKPEAKPKAEAPPASPAPAGDVYSVRRGDTLSGIAKPRGMTWPELYELNRDVVENPNLIYPGEKLRVRTEAAPAPAAPPAPPKAEPAPAPKPAPPGIERLLGMQKDSGFSGVKAHVAQAGHLIAGRFGVDSVGGRADRANPRSDHPRGLALDFMVRGEKGNQIAEFVLAHKNVLNVKYVIWQQRINHGDGWKPMGDRGSDTANHMDHVHVSFNG